MSLRIVRHRKAKRDLLQAYVFIGEDNLDAAERLLRAVNDDLKRLADMPASGPLGNRTLQSWPHCGSCR